MEKEEWWKKAVVYQIYPKSFRDSDGDGIGDLPGITEKLDYIQRLGANVIWICPVYRSPMDDGGYDISDYYHIDPMFGKDEDMETLIREADKRNIHILMDLVVNHTSDEHEWFQKALRDPESQYADYYIFRETEDGNPPNNWRSYFGGSAWERVGKTNRFYLHAFSKKQPDLNWDNVKVREEIYAMVNWWLERGIAGFRVDAICNIKKNIQYGTFPADGADGLCYIGDWILNQPGIEEYLTELHEKTFKPHNSMTVAEANVPDELLHRFIGPDGFFSMVFDFSYTDIDVPDTGEWFRPTDWTVRELREKVFHSQEETQRIGWGAVYLENHDQNRSVNKYLPAGEIGYYGKTMLASLFMMLRGTPFIYQGQEIGMENIRMDSLEDYHDLATHSQYERAVAAGIEPGKALDIVAARSRDNSRTPMQWNDSANAGFSDTAAPWIRVNKNFSRINAESQEKAGESVLEFYRELIRLRRESECADVIVEGEFFPYDAEDDCIVAYERVLGEKRILAIHNFQAKNSNICIGSGKWRRLIGNYKECGAAEKRLALRPFECAVFANW